jgi:hypothetical protein
MNIPEKSIEKLFNSLGREMAMRYYDLDLHFTVLKVEPINASEYNIQVKTDKPLPLIFDVKTEPNFTYGKYASIPDLLGNLSALLKYVGIKHGYIELPEQTYPQSWVNGTDEKAYIENPQEFIELESVGSVLEIETGYTYPLFHNGYIDTGDGWSLANIDNEDWWDQLSEEDKQKLDNIYNR